MKTNKLIYMALAIAINFALGSIVSIFQIPFLYLDTLGTVLIAAMFGPLAAVIVGFTTNIVLVFTSGNVVTAFFGIVNATIGLTCGLIFKKWGVNYKTAICAGIIVAFVAPAIGTPIALYFFGGLDYNTSDFLKLYINSLSNNFAFSVYSGKVINNLIDKIATCIFAVFIIQRLRLVRIN